VFEARGYGKRGFRPIGAARTSRYGQAHLRVSPRRTMDYRCRYDGNDGSTGLPALPVLSEAATAEVSTHVTIHARRTDDGSGVEVTGTANPRHPGTRVTLYGRGFALDAESWVIDRGRLSRRGTYELSGPLTGGPWLVYVQVAKAPGNVAGPSASRYVK